MLFVFNNYGESTKNFNLFKSIIFTRSLRRSKRATTSQKRTFPQFITRSRLYPGTYIYTHIINALVRYQGLHARISADSFTHPQAAIISENVCGFISEKDQVSKGMCHIYNTLRLHLRLYLQFTIYNLMTPNGFICVSAFTEYITAASQKNKSTLNLINIPFVLFLWWEIVNISPSARVTKWPCSIWIFTVAPTSKQHLRCAFLIARIATPHRINREPARTIFERLCPLRLLSLVKLFSFSRLSFQHHIRGKARRCHHDRVARRTNRDRKTRTRWRKQRRNSRLMTHRKKASVADCLENSLATSLLFFSSLIKQVYCLVCLWTMLQSEG